MSKRSRMLQRSKAASGGSEAYNLQPIQFIHVLDQNTNVTRVEMGPQAFICQDHETVTFGPATKIVIPPRNFLRIKNPVRRDASGEVLTDQHGQIVLAHGEEEVRLHQEPFPLFPGEEPVGNVTALQLVPPNYAVRLRALQDFEDATGEKRVGGDEWIIEGPTLLVPHPSVEVITQYGATVIKENEALRLVATQDTIDRDGEKRVNGEEWLVRRVGSYLPGVFEKVVTVVKAQILTDVTAIHVRALESFTDQFGKKRKNGEEWLVTNEMTTAFIPSVHELVIKDLPITILNSRQYAVILDPFEPSTGLNQLGSKKLVKGEFSFFLQPGERLENGVQDIFVLGEDEGLILSATEKFVDRVPDEKGEEKEVPRGPGDRWMIRGPMDYVPPVEAQVVRRNKAIPMHANEGIYVRNIKSGQVRTVVGQTYLLNEEEELWEKDLPQDVEALLNTTTEFGRVPESEMVQVPPDILSAGHMNLAMDLMPQQQQQQQQQRIMPQNQQPTRNQRGGRRNNRKWNCPSCTYENPGNVQECTMCYTAKPKRDGVSSRTPNFDANFGVGLQSMQRFHKPTYETKVSERKQEEISRRDKTRVVTYRVPHNSCVQIYDFQTKRARVVFGAALVMLGADEMFTPLRLSGGTPKQPARIHTMHLMLGPDFMTDVIAVETSDHAKLNLELSYNWQFKVPEEKKTDTNWATRLFSVGDFVGDACSKVASRVRGAVAGVAFDDFHKNSARLIRAAVFGFNKEHRIREEFFFSTNNFVITGVDIKSIEPDNKRTRELLQKSVQLAISITTQSQQAIAQQEADRRDQEARGKLQRQRINDEAEAETMRKTLMELTAECKAVETTGQARAEAQSRAAASRIDGQSRVEKARLQAEAKQVRVESDMKLLQLRRKAELDYMRRKQELEATHSATMAEIESNKFQNMIAAIGNTTIQSIAASGPQLQREMITSLGIKNVLITDGKAPINLFQSTGDTGPAVLDQLDLQG